MLRPNGTVAQRIFHRPQNVLTREQLKDMLSKPITMNFNAFKWLMFMTYSNETHSKIKLSNVRKFFNEIAPDRQLVSETTGWSLDQINTIDFYKVKINMDLITNSIQDSLITNGLTDIIVKSKFNEYTKDMIVISLLPSLIRGCTQRQHDGR